MSKINKIRLSGTTYEIEDRGATKTVELTQAQYDALVSGGTVDPNTFYVITDATAADLSQYWTSAQTQSAITEATSGKVDASTYETYTAATDTALNGKVDTSTYETYTAATETALSGKQDTLSAGTGIVITDNVISATGGGGGGGKAIEAGRGIAITTGESADTISLGKPLFLDEKSSNLQIDAEFNGLNTISQTGSNSNLVIGVQNNVKMYTSHNIICGLNNEVSNNNNIIVGQSNKVKDQNSQVFGYNNIAYKPYSTICGFYNEIKNYYEFAAGKYNNSTSGQTDSGNTLFSVGNGTANNARHNAFEIKTNGDIYITSGSSDIKLQDHLGGGGSITIDPSLDSGSTNAVANSAITEALDGKLDVSAYTPTDLSQYWTSAETQSAITNAVSGKADSSDVYTRTASNYRYMSGASITSGATYDRLYMNKGDGMTNTVAAYFGKINSLPIATKNSSAVNNFTLTEESAFTAHTGDSTIHVTSADKTAWNAKSDFSGSYNDLTDKPTIPTSASQLTNDEGYITSDALSGYAESSAVTEEIAAAVSGKADTSAVTDSINAATSGKVDTTTFETYSGSVETALSGKQDTLSAGTNITISGNVISAEGGGGKAISAGTNISVTTGETADTINCTLPITISNSVNGSKQSIAIGDGSLAHITNWYDSIAIGKNSKGYFGSIVIGSNPTVYSTGNGNNVAIGNETKFYNNSIIIGDYAQGYNGYNANSVAIGEYARTTNIVGAVAIGYDVQTTGATKTNINNQLKIDTSNQIYIKDKTNTNEVCLQDIIPSTTSAVTSGSTAVVESGAVYDQLGGMKIVKLTESEYTALVTKDESTLYVVLPDS